MQKVQLNLTGRGEVGLQVSHNADDIIKNLTNMQQKQLPFATALGLTRTAQGAVRAQKKEMTRVFDRPTPYTRGALKHLPASKDARRIRSAIFLAEFAGKGTPADRYLAPHIFGRMRRQKPHERRLMMKGILPAGFGTVPDGEAPLNRYGNINPSVYAKILSEVGALGDQSFTGKRKKKKRYYVAYKQGKPVGIRERQGQTSRKILNFAPIKRSRKIYDYYGLTERYVRKNVQRDFNSAFRYAMRTAK
jgi:hypothetical protein